jgi:hypothetical protein
MRVEGFIHRLKSTAADFGVTRFLIMLQAVCGKFIERREQVERDVGRLIVRCVGGGDVVAQRTKSRLAGKRSRNLVCPQRRCISTGNQARGDGFYVAFDAGNLSREENRRLRAKLESGAKQGWRVDVGVSARRFSWRNCTTA